jgi:hypothetical protein
LVDQAADPQLRLLVIPYAHTSERLTGAALDRLTHRCHIFEAKADGFRLQDARKRQRRAAAAH